MTYDIYFAEQDDDLIILDTTEQKKYIISADLLDYDTSYKWQIFATDGWLTTEGPIWTFKTAEEGEPPTPDRTPGFETLTLLIAVGIAVILLKRRK